MAQQGLVKIKSALTENKAAIMRMMPASMNDKRFNMIVWNAISSTPALQDCSPKSVIACVAHAAQLGLEPNSALQECYLIPFNNKGQMTATLVVDYRGFIKLAHQSGMISAAKAVAVYDNDKFEIHQGTEDRIIHIPSLDGPQGKPEQCMVGAYAVITFKDGVKQFDFMSIKEINLIKNRSRAAGNGPWVTDFAEMAKKTVLKRALKHIPKSAQLQRAVMLDNAVELGAEMPPVYDVEGEVVELDDKSGDPRDQGARIADQLAKETGADPTLEEVERKRLIKKFHATRMERLGDVDHHQIIGADASLTNMSLDDIDLSINLIKEGQFDQLKIK